MSNGSIERSQTLDILRAVAVLAVLARHLPICPTEFNRPLHYISALWTQGGWAGVDLFFVLSGFLISGLLFQEQQRTGGIDFKNFFIRRGFKIYPPFFTLIALTLVHMKYVSDPIQSRPLFGEVFFLQNYLGGFWNHTWSLAVEEHFYILLPVSLLLALRIRKSQNDPFQWIPTAFVSVATVELLLRLYVAHYYSFDNYINIFPTHVRIDSLFAGVTIGYFYYYHRQKFLAAQKYRSYLLVIGIICFLSAFAIRLETTPFMYTFGLSLLWIAGGAILTSSIGYEPKVTVWSKSLSFIGARSYSIYLFHLPWAIWVMDSMVDTTKPYNWYLYAIAYLMGSLIIGVIMAYIIEIPTLRLRDRLFPSHSRTVKAIYS